MKKLKQYTFSELIEMFAECQRNIGYLENEGSKVQQSVLKDDKDLARAINIELIKRYSQIKI